ncbi:DUF2059 domain-containing protein [Scleromatobacter humisilvae]|uniref:DUF2059 domain-containing protein n=1 Tax=Scleromatobacter humisilvae TaxID=2897159 RepID=A0A9X1YF48_9BURK|nr:DUF2059 domain-containing protein [Scleromatobacter humisilvae]MCK9685214.1 DUF2059 domain-containing protein [Scleromatobacter humisilvae]
MTLLARLALLCTLAAAAACASATPPPSDDKKQALAEFVVAYRLAEVWPQMAPKIAHDSLPRLEDATHADLDADKSPATAHARVPALLAEGRRELEDALQRFDADELAAYTAYEIYAKYFETQEIRDISTFFGSATGRKLTELAPTILAESRRPQAGNVMANHFDAQELAEIDTFWNSPTGQKMHATAEQIREDMHAHFIERSEAAVQAVARDLAAKAEAQASAASAGN